MTTSNEIGNLVERMARGLISCHAIKLVKSVVKLSCDITSRNFYFMFKCQSNNALHNDLTTREARRDTNFFHCLSESATRQHVYLYLAL